MSQKPRRAHSRSLLGPVVGLVLTVTTLMWIPTLFRTAAAPAPGARAALTPAPDSPAESPAPDNRVVLVSAPKPAVPSARPPAGAVQGDPLLAQLNAALPGLGVPAPVRIVAVKRQGERIVLTFSAELRARLSDLTALDALVGALSDRVLEAGFKHLELRVLDDKGRALPLNDLVKTPPERRPRPEPIDDGVRK